MLRKFLNWWGRNPYGDDEMPELVKDSNEFEVEYKYETTLVRDLARIADMMGREFPHSIAKIGHFRKEGSKILFTSEISFSRVGKLIPLKSLSLRESPTSDNWHMWQVDYDEYISVYKSEYMRYGKVIRGLLDLVEKNIENPDYFYVFCKYEDSIHIVANTLKDERENSRGKISEDVFLKSKEIIEKCGRAIVEKHKEIELIKELQKEAVSKSLVSRLDEELKFIDKYIEVQ